MNELFNTLEFRIPDFDTKKRTTAYVSEWVTKWSDKEKRPVKCWDYNLDEWNNLTIIIKTIK